jgi:hypothetical protein
LGIATLIPTCALAVTARNQKILIPARFTHH